MVDQNSSSAFFKQLEGFMSNRPGLGPIDADTNPHNLNNNCVFVTMARMMNMSLDDFLTHFETMQPAPDEFGTPSLAILQIAPEHKWMISVRPQSLSVLLLSSYLSRVLFTDAQQHAQNSCVFCLELTEQWVVCTLGVCYDKGDSRTHCILFERTSETPAAGFFRDLQIDELKVAWPSGVQLVFSVRPYNKPRSTWR